MAASPYLYYNNPKAAKEWMNNICGFESTFTVEKEDGTIGHAEVKHGSGIIMFGPARPADGTRSPTDVGADTASVYISTDDVEGLHSRAKAAGANITKPPYDTMYNSRDFTMKDPEGRTWFFGTYNPHKVPCPEEKAPAKDAAAK